MRLQKSTQTASYNFVIVSDKNSQLHFLTSVSTGPITHNPTTNKPVIPNLVYAQKLSGQ
jgi:hypothetical protein